MNVEQNEILRDLAPFADLGTNSPTLSATDDHGMIIRFVRNGVNFSVKINSDGSVFLRVEDEERKFITIKSMLASPWFADLAKWATTQNLLLAEQYGLTAKSSAVDQIKLVGKFSESNEGGDLDRIDTLLKQAQLDPYNSTSILLLNGPAGIGKTTFIRQIQAKRAQNYRIEQGSLILHVESRGRMLQNITDLIAFSLQTLRASVTYDQVPTLIRHGLVTLAIDGFDELVDPNGYRLAWAQINDLINEIRGHGALILAGRETFINRQQILQALTSFHNDCDRMYVFELTSLEPQAAKRWLREKGWSDDLIAADAVAPLFDEGSYALRPFFISELAKQEIVDNLKSNIVDDLLPFLIDTMIERETTKFGQDVESATTSLQRKQFIQQYMQEVARDLADNQTHAISADTLSWIAEVVAEEVVGINLVPQFRHRASVVAFLTNDERRGHRRFAHEQFAIYFLSDVIFDAIIRQEAPKFIRRNILGLETLEIFCSLARKKPHAEIMLFFTNAMKLLSTIGDADRARQNIAALITAAACVTAPNLPLEIKNVYFDEIYFTETPSAIRLTECVLNQAYITGSNLKSVNFSGCSIGTLVADSESMLSPTLPIPTKLILPDRFLTDPTVIREWMSEAGGFGNVKTFTLDDVEKSVRQGGLKEALETVPLMDLFFRVRRYKPFWIKDSEERAARRILDDPEWERLRALLIKHDMLSERYDIPSAGRPAVFYHLKHRNALNMSKDAPANIVSFFS
jgi:hypothetical protein